MRTFCLARGRWDLQLAHFRFRSPFFASSTLVNPIIPFVVWREKEEEEMFRHAVEHRQTIHPLLFHLFQKLSLLWLSSGRSLATASHEPGMDDKLIPVYLSQKASDQRILIGRCWLVTRRFAIEAIEVSKGIE